MAISPIRLTPDMDLATLTASINDTFRQIEQSNRTQIIRDENGVNRVLIGRDPKGQYVVAISKPGIDVVQKLEE